MNDTTHEQLVSEVEDLAAVVEAVAAGHFDRPNPFGTSFWAEYYGLPLDADPDEVTEAHEESILSIDQEIVVSVVYGTGGPHHEVEVTFSSEGEPLRGRVCGYWEGDQVTRFLSAEQTEAYAEALSLWETAGHV